MSVITLEEIANMDPGSRVHLYDAMGASSELFAKTVMKHIVRNVPLFHSDLYRKLDLATGDRRVLNYILAILFRGGAKSTVKVIKTCQDIAYMHEPVSLYLSEAEDQAIRDLVSVQDEVQCNEVFRGLYGDLKGDALWNRTECEFANGCYLGAKGWRSKIRGIKWKTNRPTKIWLDDFEGEGNSKTADIREEVMAWVDSQVIPATDTNASTIFMGTIIHPESWLNTAHQLDYFHGPNSAILKYPLSEYPDTPYEVSYWPERFPVEWIKARRSYYRERGQMPKFLQEYYHIPALLSEPKLDMGMIQPLECTFKKYRDLTWLESGSHKVPCYVFQGVDPNCSGENSTGADRFIVFTQAILPSGNRIILDIFAERIPLTGQISAVIDQAMKWGAKQVTIESYAYQMALYEWVRKRQQELGNYFAVFEYRENQSKSKKYIEGLVPIINTGKTAYMLGCNNIDIYLKEGRAFSGGSREHDDTLDGHYLAEHRSYAPPMFDVEHAVERIRREEKTPAEPLLSTWKTL